MRTFIFLKPDAIERKLIGRIIARFEDKGYTLVCSKTVLATPEILEQHYAEHVGKKFYPDLIASLSGRQVVCLVWDGPEDIFAQVCTMIGDPLPSQCSPGAIRGNVAANLSENLVHLSDSQAAALREGKIWGCGEAFVQPFARCSCGKGFCATDSASDIAPPAPSSEKQISIPSFTEEYLAQPGFLDARGRSMGWQSNF